MAQLAFDVSAEDGWDRQPLLDPESGCCLVFDGRLDNRADLHRRLQIDKPLAGLPDSYLVLAAWKHWGRDAPAQLLGDFCFAVWHPERQTLFLARDPLGVRPLYYSLTDRHFAFASQAKGLYRLPGVDLRVDERWVADFLTLTHSDREITIHQGIRRLPGGHWMQLDTSGADHQIERYWRLAAPAGGIPRTARECSQHFRGLLTEAVACRMRGAGPVASLLSGGLDSSTVTALAYPQAMAADRPMHAFSSVLPEGHTGPEQDERWYIEAFLAKYPAVRWTPLSDDGGDPLTGIEKIVEILGQPCRDAFHRRFQVLLDGVRETGARTLLTGFGGDHFASRRVTGTSVRLLLQLRWRSLVGQYRREKKRGLVAGPLAFGRSGLLKPLLRDTAFHRGLAKAGAAPREQEPLLALSRTLGRRVGVHRRLRGNSHSLSRHPLRNAVACEESVALSGSLAQAMEYFASLGYAWGIRIEMPLLDCRIIQAVAAYPLEAREFGTWNRLLMRQGAKGLLPPRIRLRQDKSPFWPDVASRLRQRLNAEDLEASILDGAADVEKYVDRATLRAAIRDVSEGTAARGGIHQIAAISSAAQLAIFLRQAEQRSGSSWG
nr:asparagine synthetase B [Solimonas sp. SE-A11]